MPRETYHHGNLAAEAITLALEMLESVGESGLSVRTLATALGVTHRALYNHFSSRDGLLVSLSARGFAMLASAVAGQTEPSAFVRNYADFALSRPELYAVMMRQSYAAFEQHEELRAAADKMIAASARVLAPGLVDGELVRRTVMRVWMLVHGGVALHSSGVLRARSDEDFITELLAIAGFANGHIGPPQELWPQHDLKGTSHVP